MSVSSYRAPDGFGGQWGEYTDPETGYLCLTHRYYDPRTGRFLTRDPIDYGGGINLYGYAGNNPVTGRDPSGLDQDDESEPVIEQESLASLLKAGAQPRISPIEFTPAIRGGNLFAVDF